MSLSALQISIAKSVLVLSKHNADHDEKSHGNRGGLKISDIPGNIKVELLPSGEGSFSDTPGKIPKDGYISLFHVTETETLPSIFADRKISNEKVGSDNIQGFKSGVNGVYGWSSLNRAVAEVSRASSQLNVSRSSFSIFEIKVPVFDGRLRADEDSGSKDWKYSYRNSGSAVLGGGADMDDVVRLFTNKSTRRRR